MYLIFYLFSKLFFTGGHSLCVSLNELTFMVIHLRSVTHWHFDTSFNLFQYAKWVVWNFSLMSYFFAQFLFFFGGGYMCCFFMLCNPVILKNVLLASLFLRQSKGCHLPFLYQFKRYQFLDNKDSLGKGFRTIDFIGDI